MERKIIEKLVFIFHMWLADVITTTICEIIRQKILLNARTSLQTYTILNI